MVRSDRGYRLPLGGVAYDPIAQHGGRLRSTVLDLELALEGDRVCFYVGGAILITGAELVDKLEGMVDAAIARAEEQQARADAAAARLGSAILTILTVRGIDVDAEARDRILGCNEVATLALWLERAPTVVRCEALFASTG